jgi:C-terminal processing protease CtpA/Prc
VLTTIGGKAAADYALAEIRALFRGAPGTVLPLVLTGKDGAQRTVTLTLRDYV